MQQCTENEGGATGTHDISTESGRRFSDDFHSSGTSLSWDAEFLTVTPIIHAENTTDKYNPSHDPKGCRTQNPGRGHVTFRDDVKSELPENGWKEGRTWKGGRTHFQYLVTGFGLGVT